MANQIQVNINTLKNKATELKSLNSKFKTQYENLKTTEGKLNGMWDGEAKGEFHNAFTKDVGQMQKFYTLIEKYAQNLTQIAEKYQAAERANANIARQRTYS